VRIIKSILLLTLSNSLIAATPVPLKPDPNYLFSNLHLKISSSDRVVATQFNQAYKDIRKGYVNYYKVLTLHKSLKGSNTFNDYAFWAENILKIEKSSLSSLKKTCESIKANKFKSYTQNLLNNNSKNYCFKKYITALASYKNKKNFSVEYDFIKKNQKLIFKYIHLSELRDLFSFYKADTKENIELTNLLIDYSKTSKIRPHKSLIALMSLTPNNTRFIQSFDIETYKTSRVFYSEFKKTRDEVMDKFDNNKFLDEKEEKTNVHQVLNYYNLTYEYQDQDLATKSLLAFGKSLMRRDRFKLAELCFERILRNKDFLYEDATFEIMWNDILQKKYSDALAKIENKYGKHIKNISTDSRLYYWMGFLNEKVGKHDKAVSIYKDLIAKNPLSFYSVLASKVLSDLYPKDSKEIYFASLDKTFKGRRIASHQMDFNAIKRMMLFNKLNNRTFFRQELKDIQSLEDSTRASNHILSLAYYLSKDKDYLESFKVLYTSIESGKVEVSEETLKLLFPVPYFSQIKNKSQNFDPIIALSLIRQESGFNRFARSTVGARGLMQLMPNTAKRFKRKLQDRHLYNTNLNISIGTRYFGNLMERYNNNLVYSLAAYNAGEGRVDKWQETYLTSESILKNIENIPYSETRKYVKLIFRNIFFYKMLLSSNKEDSEKLNTIYDIHLGFDR